MDSITIAVLILFVIAIIYWYVGELRTQSKRTAWDKIEAMLEPEKSQECNPPPKQKLPATTITILVPKNAMEAAIMSRKKETGDIETEKPLFSAQVSDHKNAALN